MAPSLRKVCILLGIQTLMTIYYHQNNSTDFYECESLGSGRQVDIVLQRLRTDEHKKDVKQHHTLNCMRSFGMKLFFANDSSKNKRSPTEIEPECMKFQ